LQRELENTIQKKIQRAALIEDGTNDVLSLVGARLVLNRS